MPPKKPSKFGWVLRGAALVVIAWGMWSLVGFHVSEPSGPITAAKAKSITGLTLPAEATNIRAASYSQWIEYAQYLRFEAPAEVCLSYAATIVSGEAIVPGDEFHVKRASQPLRPDAFKDFSWFDLAQAEDVVTAGGGSSQPQVWVDRVRSVFYYHKSD